MSEKQVLVDKKSIVYEGLFDMEEFYYVLEKQLSTMDYDRNETMNTELVREEGKNIEIKMKPYRKINKYVKLELKIKIVFKNVKEVELENEGAKIKVHKGKVNFSIQGNMITDYENHWSSTPFYYFIKVVMDRFIIPNEFSKFAGELKVDHNKILTEMKSFLNLNRFLQ